MNAGGPSRPARTPRDRAASILLPRGRRFLRGDTDVRGVDPEGLAVVGEAHGDSAAALPSPERLLAAISGHLDTDDGPVLAGFAHELAGLRAALLVHVLEPAHHSGWSGEGDLRRRIGTVVADIDTWRVRHLPHRTGGRSHTHSLGQVIDQVATRYVEAQWVVRHRADRRLRRTAWFHLGQAREGYADLVADIRAGRVELPLGWRGPRAGRFGEHRIGGC
ncbi:hypothetical protein [Nocardia testacea]|uniref:hypothetical protein n=1 Tax=Nocardia testacea TaxID=248551 RepID=UPI003A896559